MFNPLKSNLEINMHNPLKKICLNERGKFERVYKLHKVHKSCIEVWFFHDFLHTYLGR